jgi:hypothetical protein
MSGNYFKVVKMQQYRSEQRETFRDICCLMLIFLTLTQCELAGT